MRRERIRRNRRTLYLTLAGIGAIILFIGVFIWLVLRGAKVQGPVASSSSSSASSTSAVTQSFKSGTYTATGDVTDENGVHHDLTVYVKLTTAKTYTRLLIIDAHSQPQVINDTGSIKQKKGKLTLVSDHANVYTYTTTTTYKHKQAATVDEYSAKDASGTVLSYTTALKKELNNTISLKGKTPHNYHYLTTSLPLQRSKKKVVSLADFKTSQTASSISSSSVISSVPSSRDSQTSHSVSSTVSTEPPSSAAPSVESQHSQSGASGSNPAQTGGQGTQTGDDSEKPGSDQSNQPPAGSSSSQSPSPTDPGSNSATDTSPH